MPTIGERLAGRYRIDGQLGTGGMATVYRGHDLRLGRDVAIKMLLPHLAGDPVIAERFDREARSLAALSHPNVVAVFDVEPGDPATGVEPFFVMELCEGGSLADRISAAGGRLAPDEFVPIVAGVADGLVAVHEAGLLHRDVKPHNVLIGGGRAKLGDLGLARPEETVAQTELTMAGTALGTLAYLAPERLAGVPATAAADVWSLGALVFQGLTGSLPRPTNSVAELADRRLDVPPLVSAVAPDLGPAFDKPVAAALDPDPTRRPTTLGFASGLVAAFGRWSRDGGPGRWTAALAAGAPLSAAAPLVPAVPNGPAGADPGPFMPVAPLTPSSAGPDAAGLVLLPAAIAAASPAGAIDASDSASTASFETPPVRSARRTSPPLGRRERETRPRSRTIEWLAIVGALAIAFGGLVALVGLGGAASPTGSPSGSRSPIAGASGAASSLPASASPSASTKPKPSASPDRFAPAKARLADLRDAVAAVSGGHGIKGRAANELQGLIAQEQQALDSQDAAGARTTADQLAQTIDQDIKDDNIDKDQARTLVDAAQALRDAVANL
jgi:eukaryotic-like serine/threonine-protein kinase